MTDDELRGQFEALHTKLDALPDIRLLARNVERVMSDVALVRDDIAVLTAMVLRGENNVASILAEIRAIHLLTARIVDRVRKLEDAQP